MKVFLPQKLKDLACELPSTLYVVGGAVRNFLIDKSISDDIDLCAPLSADVLMKALIKLEMKVVAEYKRTGTVVFSDGQRKYEFTSFRQESYIGGEHKPYKTQFTQDITLDALRRDFKCNAVYYDIKNDKYVDPLDGIKDVKEKRLDTVKAPKEVFSNDGLRLMRLARFAGQLDFTPTSDVLRACEEFADNINAISPERIFSELIEILQADKKYAFSSKKGHYVGLKILEKTRVLDRILPELTLGRKMAQRADFHKYDVLEHSLRTVLYADQTVRLSALFHDIGKPFCLINHGRYHLHFSEGERIAKSVLKRLKADNKTIKMVAFLVKEHMVDIDCTMPEKKLRKFLVKNCKNIEPLLLVKQADFRAGLEQEGVCPTIIKWKALYQKMKEEKVPFSLSQLKVDASDLIELGYQKDEIGKQLEKLWETAIESPIKNEKAILIELARKNL
ncbi:MAG: HD domain-containing protein [Clostridiales bacterium]|nr:HD domain-containing protein [Clostridiales bacterium]